MKHRAMNISGKVTDEGRFVSLLHALWESRKTGTLVVTGRDVERRLFFQEGSIVADASTVPEESLERFLVERAILPEPTLQNAEEIYSEDAALVGRKLVDLGVMSEEQVRRAIRLKVKKTIGDIVSCRGGKFELVNEPLPETGRVLASFDMHKLLSMSEEEVEKEIETIRALKTAMAESVEEPEEIVVEIEEPDTEPEEHEVGSRELVSEPKKPALESQEPPKELVLESQEPRSEPPKPVFEPPKPVTQPPRRERPEQVPAALLEVIKELREEESTPPPPPEPTVPEPSKDATERIAPETATPHREPLKKVPEAAIPHPEPPEEKKAPAPMIADSAKSAPRREAIEPPPWVAAAAPRSRRGVDVVVGIVVFATLALFSAGYWIFRDSPDREVPEARTGLEKPGTGAEPDAATATKKADEDKAPPPASERRQDIPQSVDAPRAQREATATPAADSARPPVGKTLERPVRPVSRDEPEPVDRQIPASPPRPSTATSADSDPAADRPEPVVGDTSVSETTDSQPVVETTPPANPTAGGAASENEIPAAGETGAKQPELTGWQSAVFAPKPAIIKADPPSKPAVQPGQLVESGPDVIDPVLIEHPKLKYPKQAKRAKVETVVRVRVLVDENGNVLEAELDKKYGYGLDEAALEIALKAKFIPATKGTVKVKMWTSLPLAYRLD